MNEKSKWIDASDRTPDSDRPVLMKLHWISGKDTPMTGRYGGDDKAWELLRCDGFHRSMTGSAFYGLDRIQWMEIPE